MPGNSFDDEPHVQRIEKALWSREPSGTAVVLVGAGFSRNAVAARAITRTMPGWNDIYTEMVSQLYPANVPASAGTRQWLLQQTGSTSAYLRIAEEYEAQFRRDGLDKLILKHVPDEQFEPGELHRQLLQLPWADVMTTNWDTLLERAGAEVEDRVYDVVRTAEEIPQARAPRIVKLHGSFPSSRPFIFTEEDFRTYPTRFAPFVNLAQQLGMENTLVLLGFSGDDPNFLYWSGWVRDRLGAKAPLIYLVGALDLSSSKRKMLEDRGVQPIDLARLAPFLTWPDTLRVQHANQWFLERLRAAEPYQSRRWPRPQAGPVPPLELVTPRADPSAPPEDSGLGNGDLATKIRRLVEHCRLTRLAYPGWVVAPMDAANYVWNGLRPRLIEVGSGLGRLPPEERLEVLYEIDWQLQVSLVPLSLALGDQVTGLLDELEPAFQRLDGTHADMFRALALSAVRLGRETGDEALFTRWADWLTPHVAHRPDERHRLTYERCLRLRADLQLAELEAQVSAWVIDGDPYWDVRRAGILSDLGREKEANKLSASALNEIRRRTTRGANDIASWSRESYAMLLRSTFLYGDLGSWSAHKPTRDRFDQRQDLLAARGCTGRQDFFRFIELLDQVPPPLQTAVERTTRFDIGSSNVKLRFGGSSHAERRLLAFRAIRYLDETGLPAKIGNVGVGSQMLEHAARWLIDVEPNGAVDALMRGSAKPGGDTFEALFDRATIASSDLKDADRLIGRLLRLADAAHGRFIANTANRMFWLDHLKVATELISRFILRVPGQAPEALQLALKLCSAPRLTHQLGIPDQIKRLITRSIEAQGGTPDPSALRPLFDAPVPADPSGYGEVLDPASAVRSLGENVGRTPEWSQAVDLALDAASAAETRRSAILRLATMRDAGLLDEAQDERFGTILWQPAHMTNGLPGMTSYFPWAFLQLPAPDEVNVRGAIAGAILGEELDDDKVMSGALTTLLASDCFALEGEELVEQITRLRRFIEHHPPAPTHPDIMGDRRGELIEQTASAFANLARLSIGVEAARRPIAELANLDRHPLRTEPAIPALVAIGIMSRDDGLAQMRALFVSKEGGSERLLGIALGELVRVPASDPVFEQAIWTECGTSLLARRPGAVTACLGFLIIAFQKHRERVPNSIDADVLTALDIIREETAPDIDHDHLLYEPHLARFRAAILAALLKATGRGSTSVIDAWERAAAEDPLPDVRRAWDTGLILTQGS